ncbi:cation transporter [Paenibacillus hexagrammi]|uniref:Cation transporter n=1 Tax=Paenibacillus hexagrammi TaxID=2908839 RepID=A0ABY3SPB6_9BACL|nr:cation transporter [Paenibacillus sp. YPD9-1]UJF34936.1 cation transporter [Paenibacillus sp. YPD9-1]
MNNESTLQQVHLHIEGMTCAACSARIEKAVGKMDGVRQISVNLTMGRAALLIHPGDTTSEHIVQRIEQLGYTAKPLDQGEKKQSGITALGVKLALSALLTVPLLWAMVRHYEFTSGIWIPELFCSRGFSGYWRRRYSLSSALPSIFRPIKR